MDKAKEIEFLKRFIKEVMNLHDNIKQFTDDGTLQQRSEQIGVMYMNHLRERGVDTSSFSETEENKILKTEYVKATFIYDDIKFYHENLQKEAKDAEELIIKYQHVKAIMLPLALLYKNLKTWTKLTKDNDGLMILQKALCDKLEFANYMRNKISAHIENEILCNTVQWEPLIFQDYSKKDKTAQRLVLYRSLLEASINSYQDDKTGKRKIFQKEIDLNLPYYAEMFFEYLYQTVEESLHYLSMLIPIIDLKIRYFTGLPEDLMRAAGETNFKLKARGR